MQPDEKFGYKNKKHIKSIKGLLNYNDMTSHDIVNLGLLHVV